jgi:hypothetical protein
MSLLRKLILPGLVCGLVGIPALAQQPVGMVLKATGKVTIVRAGNATQAQLGEVLVPGDRLVIESGTVEFLFCPLSSHWAAGGGTSLLIGEEGIDLESGPEPTRAPAGPCALPRVRLGSESLERVGALRPRGKPPIEVYLGGTVSAPRPDFSWESVGGAVVYRVRLSDEAGTVLWEEEVPELSATYSGEPLEDGWYSWSVSAEKDGEVLAEQNTGIEIRRSPEPLEQLPREPAELLVHAIQLENEGYFSEAAAALRMLSAQRPDDERLRRRLAWLYWKAGLLIAFNSAIAELPDAPATP